MIKTGIVLPFLFLFTLIISGCSGSDTEADESPNAGRTLFTVTVSDPVTQKRITRSNHALSDENFEVAVVDEAGVVIEVVTITAENIIDFGNGSYGIYVPGNPRLDCVIVADISGTITVTVGSPLPAGSLYAPTTSLNVDIDVQSTLAYQNFLETVIDFTDYTIDEVENLVNQVQSVDITLPLDGQSLEEYLLAVEAQISAAIETEIEFIISGTDGDIATLLEGAGGHDLEVFFNGSGSDLFYVYYSANPDTLEFFVDTYFFSNGGFVKSVNNCVIDEDCEYILSPTGWVKESATESFSYVKTANGIRVNDGTFDYDLTSQVVDLSAKNMAVHTLGTEDAYGADLLPITAVFSSGAEYHRVTVISNNPNYYLDESEQAYIITGDGDPGNDGQGVTISNLDELIVSSATEFPVLINTTGIVSAHFYEPGTFGSLHLEFVSSGALNFYRAATTELIGSGTWEHRQVNGEDILVVLSYPEGVGSYSYESNELTIFSIVNNVVLQGYKESDDSAAIVSVYNQIAFDDYIQSYSE